MQINIFSFYYFFKRFFLYSLLLRKNIDNGATASHLDHVDGEDLNVGDANPQRKINVLNTSKAFYSYNISSWINNDNNEMSDVSNKENNFKKVFDMDVFETNQYFWSCMPKNHLIPLYDIGEYFNYLNCCYDCAKEGVDFGQSKDTICKNVTQCLKENE